MDNRRRTTPNTKRIKDNRHATVRTPWYSVLLRAYLLYVACNPDLQQSECVGPTTTVNPYIGGTSTKNGQNEQE